MNLFSYVVDHDRGYAPNPYFGFCTLCRCKFSKQPQRHKDNIVELAQLGDWIIGTGGANSQKSAGHGKLVYAMQVEEKLSGEQYYSMSCFRTKKPVRCGSYEQRRGDNENPRNSFEREEQFVLISRDRFYY